METVKLGLLIKKTKVARCGEHSYPVLSITKQDGIIMQSEKFKKRIASADTSDYKIIPRGKLVQGIHIDEGNFGIQDIVDNGIVSPAYGVWDVNDGLVIPKYLEMVLRSPKSIEFYRSKLTGTVNRRGHMSDADFLSMDIPLPDRDTQSKILKTMKQTTSVLYSRQQQLAKLDELIKARFVEMFGDPVINEAKWPIERLEKHLTIIGGYAFKSDGFKTEGIPVLRIGNINSGHFLPTNMVYWHDDPTLERYKTHPGDLVISLTGTVGKNDYGNVCILGNSYNSYYLNQRNAKLELKETLNSMYLSELLKFPKIKSHLTGISRGIRQANISNKDILSLPISIPPLSLQNQFADFVAEVDKSKVEVQKALDQTQLLFDSLMQQYFG